MIFEDVYKKENYVNDATQNKNDRYRLYEVIFSDLFVEQACDKTKLKNSLVQYSPFDQILPGRYCRVTFYRTNKSDLNRKEKKTHDQNELREVLVSSHINDDELLAVSHV